MASPPSPTVNMQSKWKKNSPQSASLEDPLPPTSQRHSNRFPELKPPGISGVAISLGELWNTVPRWGKKEQARESAQQAAQSTRSLLFGALSAKAVSGRSWTQSNDAQLPLTGGTPWLKRLSGCDSSWPAKCHPKANRVFFPQRADLPVLRMERDVGVFAKFRSVAYKPLTEKCVQNSTHWSSCGKDPQDLAHKSAMVIE